MIKSYKLFLESRSEIESICKQYYIQNWTLNEDGSIDVDGGVDLSAVGLSKFPVKFGNVSGVFYCCNNRLTSLEGCPKSVGKSFFCDHNQLISLEGCPESIIGNFYCDHNQLISLEGGPRSVGANFYCDHNQLTSLEGAPESVGQGFYCYSNQLTSLKGAPKSVGGDFHCCVNDLTSLEGAPKSVGGVFWCDDNQLTSLEGCSEYFRRININNNPIHEFTNLFYSVLTPDIVRYLNEYDVIQDDVIVLDRLKEVVETLGVQFNFSGLNGLKNYKLEY